MNQRSLISRNPILLTPQSTHRPRRLQKSYLKQPGSTPLLKIYLTSKRMPRAKSMLNTRLSLGEWWSHLLLRCQFTNIAYTEFRRQNQPVNTSLSLQSRPLWFWRPGR